MARTCVWCGDPLPEPEHRGHRRREFCKPPRTCKQQHYLWHKKMKHAADALADPYWRRALSVLVEHYKFVERLLQDRVADLEEERKRADELEERLQYRDKRYEDLCIDYAARLRALGMSEREIEEFHKYWSSQRVN